MDGKIKLFVISYNRLHVLERCIESYKLYFDQKDMFIIDKGSDYEPLKKYYKQLESDGITVIYSQPMLQGAAGPGGLNDLYKDIDKYKGDCRYYVVTDPDIDISDCKKDMLDVYCSILDKYEDIDIVGPMLKIDDIPFDYPARELCFNLHVKQFWKKKPCLLKLPGNSVYVQKAPIDSTFGMVRGTLKYQRLLQGFRTYFPYEAKHLDWYITPNNITDDQKSYLEKNGDSKISHWSASILKHNPKYHELTGEQRKIYKIRSKWGKLEAVSTLLAKSESDEITYEKVATILELEPPHSNERAVDSIDELKPADIEMIRDVSLLLEKVNINLSHDLMSIAKEARPKGPLINKMLSHLKTKIAQKKK